MCGGGGDGGAGEARAREEARQASIRAGMGRIDEAFAGFNDDFYGSRTKAYTDYAAPQLDDQYKKAQDELTYALSRSGLLNSQVGAEKVADLRKTYDRNKQSIDGTAVDYANQARGDVERGRSDIVSQLNATADPASAAQAAVARAGVLNAMPSFQPLGQLFANVAGVVGQSLEADRNKKIANQIGLYNSGGSSSRIVN